MRTFRLLIKAPTALQMEEMILAEARSFFGPYCTLEILRNYEVGRYGDGLIGAVVTVIVSSDLESVPLFN